MKAVLVLNGGFQPKLPQKPRSAEYPENKTMRLQSFSGPAFQKYLRDELTTVLTATEVRTLSLGNLATSDYSSIVP